MQLDMREDRGPSLPELRDWKAVGSTVTLGRAGIQHRVRMTGNQPGHDDLLPRPEHGVLPYAKRAACLHSRTLVLSCQSLLFIRATSQGRANHLDRPSFFRTSNRVQSLLFPLREQRTGRSHQAKLDTPPSDLPDQIPCRNRIQPELAHQLVARGRNERRQQQSGDPCRFRRRPERRIQLACLLGFLGQLPRFPFFQVLVRSPNQQPDAFQRDIQFPLLDQLLRCPGRFGGYCLQ